MATGSQRRGNEKSSSSLKHEVIIDPYRVYLQLEGSTLLHIEAEHRRTKQVYRKENIDNKQVESITNGFSQTAEDFFNVIQDVVAQAQSSSANVSSKEQEEQQKQIRQTCSIEEKGNTLELRFDICIGLGKSSTRKWSFVIDLKKVEMDDVARHERIIADLCRRIEQFEERFVPPLDQIRSLSNVKFCAPNNAYQTLTLSNNNKTCTAINHQNVGTGGELSVDQTFTANKNDELLRISFRCTTGAMQNVRVGVKVDMTTNSYTVSSANSREAWYFNLQNGHRQQGLASQMPYQSAVMLNQKVTVVLNIKKKKVAFVIDDDADTWAFKLPNETDITRLRPFIVVQGNGDSITIVDE